MFLQLNGVATPKSRSVKGMNARKKYNIPLS